MGRWKTHADGEPVTPEEQDEWVQEKEFATIALRDTASSGWGSAELGRDCLVVETGKKYYWNGASWEKYPATGGAGAPVDATYVTTSVEPGLNNEVLHKNLVGANLHVPQTHTHTESDVTDLDHDAQKIKGKTVDTAGLADNDILQYDLASQKWKPETIAGGGDMTKAVYDGNDDGVVEDSDKLEGSTKAQVQDHNPKAHPAEHAVGGSQPFLSTHDLDAIARVEVKQGGVSKGKRRAINLIAGSGIAYNITDDAGNEEVDVNISATGGTSYKLAASYTVYKVGSYYYAMDADGNVDYSGTNAATVINNALGNLTGGRTWKEKVLLKGTFTLTASLTPDSYTVLDLSAARLDVGASVHAISMSSKQNVEILGGIIDGNKGSGYSGVAGIYMTGQCHDCIIDGVQLLNIEKYGIHLEGTSGDGCYKNWIQNCYLYDIGDTASYERHAIRVRNSDDNWIVNNYIDKNGMYGAGITVTSTNYPTDQSERNKIYGNTVVNGASSASDNSAHDGILAYGDYNEVIGNYVDNFYSNGIDMHGKHWVCSNNVVREGCKKGDLGWGFIHVVASQYGVCSNNTVIGSTTGTGINVKTEEADTVTENTFIGNSCYGMSQGFQIIGKRNTYIGNKCINNSSRGMYFRKKTNAVSSYSLVHNNYFYNCGTGIYERDHDYLSIHDNIFRSCTTATDTTAAHHNEADNVTWA